MNVYSEAADFLIREIENLFKKNGKVSLGLSGGNTPKYIYNELVSRYSDFPHWRHVDFYFGDERFVPADSEYSNYGLAVKTLFTPLKIPENKIHRIPTYGESAGDCAVKYTNLIFENKIGNGYDMTVLGMGPDAHVASIFPRNTDALFAEAPYVSTGIPPREPPVERITAAMPFINRSGIILLVAKGKEKKKIYDFIVSHKIYSDIDYPISFLNRGKTRFFVEE